LNEADAAGYESTANEDDVVELSRDIETWLNTHTQKAGQ
jgi:hypothetical protein